MNPIESLRSIAGVADALSVDVEFHSAKAKEMAAAVSNCRQIEKRLNSLIEQRRDAIQRQWNARRELRISRLAISDLIKTGSVSKISRRPKHNADPADIESKIFASSAKIDRSVFRPGIYFLFLGKSIVYVGQSVNVLSRIASHKEKMFDRFSFFPCREDELDELERAFINVFLPVLNVDQKTLNLKALNQQ